MRIQRRSVSLLAVVAVAATFNMVCAEPIVASGSPGQERIVFSAPLPGGGAAVTTVAPDGSGAADVVVPADLEDFNKTVWSHDGTRLLYSNVMIFDGNGEVVAFRPATSAPDGSDFHLLKLPSRPMDMYCSAWSPDDTRIICSAGAGGLISMRASDGGGRVKLTTNPYGGQDLAVGYSPDGSQFAWLRERPGATDDAEREALFVSDSTDVSHPRRLTRWGLLQAHELAGANWSPDGLSIVSATRRGRLVVVDAVAGGATPIPLDLRSDDFAVTPDYSPDGAHIVFTMFRNRPADLYIATTDGADLRRLTRTTKRSDLFPDWAGTP